MSIGRNLMLVIILILAVGHVAAQDGSDPGADNHTGLVLFSVDETRPALFQALALGDDPVATAFETRLDVPLDSEESPSAIYVAIENTGWSVGAVGLIGGELDPDGTYIAIELWERMGRFALRDDGQGLIFPLEYVEDLDGDETPGFRLDVVTDQGRVFQIYRVSDDEDGLFIWGRVMRLEGAMPESELASYVVVPEPVFGDLLLDFHIIALPEPLPTRTPSPTPDDITLTPPPSPLPGNG